MGRPTEKKDYFNTPAPDLTHSYSYNGRSELIADAMSRGGTYSYAYDNIGNRMTSQEGAAGLSTIYTANRLNQYTDITQGEETPFVPTYDADGNQTKLQTSTGEWEVVYNALNQAVVFTQGSQRVECRYDYLNRRVEKAVYEGEALMSKKRFIYHGYLQIAELDATNGTETVVPILRKTYLWDPMEPVATRILAMTIFNETGVYDEDLYYTHDLLKNTTALFGIQAGRRALYEYGAYGNVLKMEGNAAQGNPFRFSSEYTDDELGLMFYNYRYYNPNDGRWVSRDPMMEGPQENLYGYVDNLTSAFIDVRGEFGFALPALLNPIGLIVAAVAVTAVAITEVIAPGTTEKVIKKISENVIPKPPIALPRVDIENIEKIRECEKIYNEYHELSQKGCPPCTGTCCEQLKESVNCKQNLVDSRRKYLENNCDDYLPGAQKYPRNHVQELKNRINSVRECKKRMKKICGE